MATQNKDLKHLSKALGLSAAWLNKLAGGSGEKASEFVRLNSANCARAMAYYTGYNSEEAAKKAIKRDAFMLFYSLDRYASNLEKLLPKYSQKLQKILLEAIAFLRAGNDSGFNSTLSLHEPFKKYRRNILSKPDTALMDKFRSSPVANKETAKRLLNRHYNNKILVPYAAIMAEVDKRAKRYGVTGSLFWQAAKELNPKIKNSGKQKLPKGKTQIRRTRGSKRVQKATNEITVNMNHYAESVNPLFRGKVDSKCREQEAFWTKQAEKQVMAATYMKKLLKDV